MNVIARDYVFIGMDKTGSSSLRKLITELEGEEGAWFSEETSYDLPPKAQDLPIIGSTRNPFTWYPSYWTWYREGRFQDGWRGIDPSLSFLDWVRGHKGQMVVEFNRLYRSNVNIVRMEYQSEDLIRILTEIRGPLSDETIKKICSAEIINRNPNPKPNYTEELKELVLEGAFPIFENYYPEREFLCGG